VIRAAIAVALASVMAAACGPTGGSGEPGSGSADAGGPSGSAGSADVSPPTAAGSDAPASPIEPGMFANPVIDADFPDPFVARFEDRYYAYATTDAAQHLQLARSDDLVTWEMLDDPLPKLPAWSTGDTWAPEVLKTAAGYVLYYTAHHPDIRRPDGSGSQCITLAVSSSPEGPFVDRSDKPLVCQNDIGGSIDATPFVDADGTLYLIWKNDGNCCGRPTKFWIQALSDDGLKLIGTDPIDLGVVNDEPWEGSLIEAPTLVLVGGTYYLFFSANGYDTEFYAVGYATSKKVTGPYTDAPENPILSSAWDPAVVSRARGPGHQSVVETPKGELWMAYHAWDQDAVGYGNFGKRSVWIDRLTIADGKATVHGPTGEPQPIP
jgi:beta-xylosidase